MEKGVASLVLYLIRRVDEQNVGCNLDEIQLIRTFVMFSDMLGKGSDESVLAGK